MPSQRWPCWSTQPDPWQPGEARQPRVRDLHEHLILERRHRRVFGGGLGDLFLHRLGLPRRQVGDGGGDVVRGVRRKQGVHLVEARRGNERISEDDDPLAIEADLPDAETYNIDISAVPVWTAPGDGRSFTVNISAAAASAKAARVPNAASGPARS